MRNKKTINPKAPTIRIRPPSDNARCSFQFACSQGASKRLMTGIPSHSRNEMLIRLLIKKATAEPRCCVCGHKKMAKNITVGYKPNSTASAAFQCGSRCPSSDNPANQLPKPEGNIFNRKSRVSQGSFAIHRARSGESSQVCKVSESSK